MKSLRFQPLKPSDFSVGSLLCSEIARLMGKFKR